MTPEQEAKQKALMANMDFSVLDGTLDDIDDLPSFAVFPGGCYHIILEDGLLQKPIGTHPGVECAMKLIEVKELANPVADEADKPKPGDICTSAYMLDNPFGTGKLKMDLFGPLGTKFGTKNNREIMAKSKGVQAIVVMERQEVIKDGVKKQYCKIVRFVPL